MVTRGFKFRLFFCLLTGLGSSALPAQVVVASYVETGSLPANDDDYTLNAVALGFSINFGGTTYSETYISNNGYITFGSGDGEYDPVPLDAAYDELPMIAAFFSDVDTRAIGTLTWGTGLVDGRAAFVVTWDNVGEYSRGTEPNTFGLTLVSRADTGTGNFDIFLSYETITWDHGEAVAGFHTGGDSTNPLFYQLPGSMQTGAFLDNGPNSLTAFTNNGSGGDFLLSARDGGFLAVAPIVAIPEPSTYALLALGGSLLWLTARRRRT